MRCSSSHCGRRLVGWDDQSAALHFVFAVMFYTKYCCIGERGKIHCLMVNNNSRTSNYIVSTLYALDVRGPMLCLGFCEAFADLHFESCRIYFDPRELYWDNFEDDCDSVEILRVCV